MNSMIMGCGISLHEKHGIPCGFKYFLEDISPFVGPLMTLLWTSCDVCPGFQSQDGSLTCVISHLCDPQIHLWCDTC